MSRYVWFRVITIAEVPGQCVRALLPTHTCSRTEKPGTGTSHDSAKDRPIGSKVSYNFKLNDSDDVEEGRETPSLLHTGPPLHVGQSEEFGDDNLKMGHADSESEPENASG